MNLDVLTMRAAMHGNLEAQGRLFAGMPASRIDRDELYPAPITITRQSDSIESANDSNSDIALPGLSGFRFGGNFEGMKKLDEKSFEEEFQQRMMAATAKERKP